jgi:hypothetical protein
MNDGFVKSSAAENIDDVVQNQAKNGELPCAVAFDIADKLKISPAAVGECADRLKISLVKCQLGLFGYMPEKKIINPALHVGLDLKTAIEAALVNGRLPCASAWAISKKLKIRKMDVSSAGEALGIKIKPCQLGAF